MNRTNKNRRDVVSAISITRKGISMLLMLTMLCLMLSCAASPRAIAKDAEQERHYLGQTVNAGKDDGYSKDDAITADDPHFGWALGDFFVEGYTSIADKDAKVPVFLKNAGDEVSLWFNLSQNIDKLNGDDKLSIAQDKNGYDERLGVEKTNFKRGTLIVRYTDYQNKKHKPVVYTDFLTARAEKDADTKIKLFEEGDYEVALDYEISNARIRAFGKNLMPSYTDYRIAFRFSVRNGNSMVFPFDVKTGDELSNAAFTENGFVLDFAKSRYLDITVKYAVASETEDGVTEDVRFNRPAKDGDTYDDEGVYTITAKNAYTNQKTVKKIYVGTDNVLKVYTATGMSVKAIREQLSRGLVVARDGTLISPDAQDDTASNDAAGQDGAESAQPDGEESISDANRAREDDDWYSVIPAGIAVVAVLVLVVVGVIRIRLRHGERRKAKALAHRGNAIDVTSITEGKEDGE